MESQRLRRWAGYVLVVERELHHTPQNAPATKPQLLLPGTISRGTNMQIIISSEEKQELDRFFSDLDFLLDYEMQLGEYNSQNENQELLEEAARGEKLSTLLSSLAKIYAQQKSIAKWLK
jgi:hypothetical protein